MPEYRSGSNNDLKIVAKRLATLTGAKPTQLLVPTFFHRWTMATNPRAVMRTFTYDQLCRWRIWIMPFWYTDCMRDLDKYYRSLVRGPDAKLSRADHQMECIRMYKTCRAIVNERRGAKW